MVYENFLLCTGSCDSQWLATISSYAKQESKQHMSLCDFKLDIATWLLSSNKHAPKRGRPSQQDNPPKTPKKKKEVVQPAESVRWDGSGH